MASIKCCKDCAKRYVGCHAKCEEYLAERKTFDEIAEKRKQMALADTYHFSSVERSIAFRNNYEGKKGGIGNCTR